ncbi:hypothetical protein [Stenotrophomonas sp.]|uniref:hypothetical protein n=1 Tax=Stenotrophomonas sp. TaxID=69392 RepID=UPI0028A62F85|nr:hypothetical protein [Stenotrophomonas sp.]
MTKSLEGIQLALFFAKSPDINVDDLCRAATGNDPDSTERQKATGIVTATLLEDKVQIRFVLSPVRCDIYFSPEMEPSQEFPPKSSVPFEQVFSFASRVCTAASAYLKEAQRVGLVIATVQDYPSPAAALVGLKKALPFSFDAPPSSEDVVVQYNVKRSVTAGKNTFELNQLFNKQTGVVQMVHVGPHGANLTMKSALRETVDVNTYPHPDAPPLAGGRLESATGAVIAQAKSVLQTG